MAYRPDQIDTDLERDQINPTMRASAAWRDTITSFGLNPDGPLHLTKDQRKRLAAVIGFDASDNHIDPAGNINDFHGWKGLPTAAKIAIIAGATVATAGGIGAATGAGWGAGATLGMGTGAPGALGLGGGAAVTGASTAPLVSTAAPVTMGAGTAIPVAVGGSTAAGSGVAAGGLAAGATAPLSSAVLPNLAAPVTMGAGTALPVASGTGVAAGVGGGLAMDPITKLLVGGSTISNYFGARNAAKAAKDAAKMQAEAADKALAFQRTMWEDTQRNQAPWLQAGTGAINTLANLGGIPMMAPGTAPSALIAPQPTGGGSLPPLAPGVTRGPMPISQAVSSPLAAPQAPRPVGSSATPAAMGGQSSYVMLQAPDGTQQRVPEQFASAFEAKGARRVA